MTLKVIGAGLPRTSTLSLKLALEQLGLGPCYHMSELVAAPKHAQLWIDAADGHPRWSDLFDGPYQSTTDFPGCLFWRSLAEAYPDAKVVLTTRDPHSWFESMEATVGRRDHHEKLAVSPIGPMMAKVATTLELGDRDSMVAAFREHERAVTEAIDPDRLLVFHPRQGWEPLCAFLGVPVPDAPYPRVNSRDDAETLIADDGRAASFEMIRARAQAFLRACPYRAYDG